MSDAEFDRFADRYRDEHAANIAASGEEPEYFARYKMRDFRRIVSLNRAPGAGRYLDFGCGVGNSVAPFQEFFPQGRLLAADVSSESLKKLAAAHDSDRVATLLIEQEALPLSDGSVDGAFACCVFHHIEPAAHVAALRELRRVMRPGAPLMIYEHNPLNPLTVRAVNTCALDDNAILIRAGEMRRRVQAAGFTELRVEFRVFFPASLKWLRPMEDWLKWLPLGAQYLVSAAA